MIGYRFHHLHRNWPTQPETGTWLWIWNADKIPPHIAISNEKQYFSLTFKECEIAKSVSGMIRKAKRARIPLVLVDLSAVAIQADFRSSFQQYERAVANQSTCLSPIKDVLGVSPTISQLSELLTELEQTDKLKEVFALHLADNYYGIPAYSVSDIMQRIEQLHDANRSESPLTSR